MLFLIGFAWHVAASFAHLLAILSPKWVNFPVNSTSNNFTVQRGIFYVCNLISVNATDETNQCTSLLDVSESINPLGRWNYKFALSIASIAIGCAGLSVIVLWLFGVYFNVTKKNICTSCFLFLNIMLSFITFCASAAVWILVIVEVLILGYTVDRSMFGWPFWLDVGATGGFLFTFITMIMSLCATLCRRKKKDSRDDRARNQF